ncbi:MAG: FRG domain-containing protein, partial [Betaproteobacteria bacterium]|nr:FRG domain-containing protein [Betaproteobacteria bacterium]
MQKQAQAKNSPSKPAPIKTVAGFLEWCGKHRRDEYMLYRGISRADWKMKVSASLYRRLVQANNDKNVQDDIFVGAVEDLIELAKMEGHGQKNGAELCPLELLAELQHYGAATCFIDFTKNPL